LKVSLSIPHSSHFPIDLMEADLGALYSNANSPKHYPSSKVLRAFLSIIIETSPLSKLND